MRTKKWVNRSRSWRAVMTIAVIGVATTVVLATQIRSVNLEEMTARAARIFSGRCIDLRTESHPLLSRPVMVAVFQVDRAIKGDLEDALTVRMFDPPSGEREDSSPELVGVPRFTVGEEVILFLYGESRLGFTSPVGMGQGKFEVFEDKLGRKLAMNEFGNSSLLRDVERDIVSSLLPEGGPQISRDALDHAALLDALDLITARVVTGESSLRSLHD